jgi:hypothetical protein
LLTNRPLVAATRLASTPPKDSTPVFTFLDLFASSFFLSLDGTFGTCTPLAFLTSLEAWIVVFEPSLLITLALPFSSTRTSLMLGFAFLILSAISALSSFVSLSGSLTSVTSGSLTS